MQQAIEPPAVALAIFGGLAALALLVLAGQSLAQIPDRAWRNAARTRPAVALRAE